MAGDGIAVVEAGPIARENSAKRKVGRPTKNTPEVTDRLIEAIATGLSYEDSAIYAGISLKTFENWRNRINSPEATDEDREFLRALKAAEVTGKIIRTRTIAAGAPGWQGSAWIQERRYRDEWGASQKIDLTVKRSLQDVIAEASLDGE